MSSTTLRLRGALTEMSPEARARQRDWVLFILLTFLFSFGFSVYSGVFQNFLRDTFHSSALGLGKLESIREIPGLLAALMAGTLVSLAEARVAGLGLFIAAVGIGCSGLAGNYTSLVMLTVFWSVGFHLWASVSPAITLALARGEEGGKRLGQMAGVGSAATLMALGAAWGLARFAHIPYKTYFFIAGVSICGAAVLCSLLSAHTASVSRARIVLRREYSLFYLLTFLEGCRRQIFSIFASFALILIYHVPLKHMLLLQFVNAFLIIITAPLVGRLTDRRGERYTLTFYALGLILVFLGYSLVRNVTALYGLFLIDNVLFSFGVGFTTYLRRIARPHDLTPCLAMGVTMNHIAAVTVPIGGAWLWVHCHNYQLPFYVGVAVAALSLITTRWLD